MKIQGILRQGKDTMRLPVNQKQKKEIRLNE